METEIDAALAEAEKKAEAERKAAFEEVLRQARIAYWIKATGLPPPDCRGFVPRLEGDERPRVKPSGDGHIGPLLTIRQRWRIRRGGVRYDQDPGFDDVIRAYEEDR